MRDCIGSDQVLKPKDVLQKMLTYDQVSAPGVRAADIVEDALEHFQQKRSGAAGEIEHRHAVIVGKTLADAERLLSECRPPRAR